LLDLGYHSGIISQIRQYPKKAARFRFADHTETDADFLDDVLLTKGKSV
jgi:hypothetical protein